MHCYEVSESVRPGIACTYPYLYLGHPGREESEHLPPSLGTQWAPTAQWAPWQRALTEGQAAAPCARIPFGAQTRAQVTKLLGHSLGKHCVLTRADLYRAPEGPQLELEERPDSRALVLVRTAPGVGGIVSYRHNNRVECIFALEERGWAYDYDTSDRLFILDQGAVLRISRTGELEGARAEFILGWDVDGMHELHDTARLLPLRSSPSIETSHSGIGLRNGLRFLPLSAP